MSLPVVSTIDTRPNLGDFLPEELRAALQEHGISVDETKALRIYAAAVGRGEGSLERVKGLAKPTREAIEAKFAFPSIRIKERRASPTDGFVKYLFTLADGAEVEAVRIPIPCEPPDTDEGNAARQAVTGTWKGKEKKYVVCVSSQVGCALGCSFCATATLGFRRHLRPSEIIAQVLAVKAEADRPVRGVVFMGMGEPFHNYDAVIRAAKIFSHPVGVGISASSITISTAGLVPQIRRFTSEGHKFRLAISFTSAIAEKRRVLMPIEKAYPTQRLVAALKEHAEVTGERVTVAYVAIGGPDGNCLPEDAHALGRVFADVPIRLDLIDVNGEVGGYQPPSREELKLFRDTLDQTLRQPVARRYSGGKDIDAACGMLAAKSVERAAAGL
jgi:23S rRNA (adenine2503-C2)-methyltransferase